MLDEKRQQRAVAAEIAQIAKEPIGNQVPFIGIAGIPAAGKSTLCEDLRKILAEDHKVDALVVGMDGYHYYRSELDQMDDPVEAHARRGAEFTFDADRFVKDMKKAAVYGVASFPSFDHAKKDPEQHMINFDKDQHQVVIVEGLYVLLEKEPWSELKRELFAKTFFVDTDEERTRSRLKNRMINEMKLSSEEAEGRIEGNDLVNAKYIKENMDMTKHKVLEITPTQ